MRSETEGMAKSRHAQHSVLKSADTDTGLEAFEEGMDKQRKAVNEAKELIGDNVKLQKELSDGQSYTTLCIQILIDV
jgi:hypothetical protein